MKLKLLFACIALTGIVFASCSENDQVYSCDPTIDQWVKDNLGDIKEMKRDEWILLDERVKGPTFGAFEPEQKIDFWQEKLTEVLMLNWSPKEKAHIESLRDFISTYPNFFDTKLKKTEQEQKEFDLYVFRWIDYAKNELGWEKEIIGSIVASGNRLLNTKGVLEFSSKTMIPMLKSAQEPYCECNVTYDFCYGQECYDTGCLDAPYCGWFLLSSCNGECGF